MPPWRLPALRVAAPIHARSETIDTITPGDSGAIGIAFVWRNFDLADLPGMMRACVMVTVPANNLIATLPTDRMPAVLADRDWATWLGETGTPADAKRV